MADLQKRSLADAGESVGEGLKRAALLYRVDILVSQKMFTRCPWKAFQGHKASQIESGALHSPKEAERERGEFFYYIFLLIFYFKKFKVGVV